MSVIVGQRAFHHMGWLFMLSIMTAYSHAESVLTVKLLPTATVYGDWIFVRDIVDLSSLPLAQDQQQMIADMLIAHAPPVSHSLTIEKESVLQKLLSYDLPLALAGAEEVEVRRYSQVIDASLLKRALTKAIAQELTNYEITPDQYHIDGLDRIHDVRVPSSQNIRIEVERFQPQLPASRVMAWVDIWTTDTRLESISIPLKVEIVQQVWTTTRQMEKGELIGRHDLSSEVVNNSDLQYWPANRDIVGTELQRDVNKGSPLARTDLGPRSLFTKDELVVATLNSGIVNLELAVKLLGPANPGQRVTAERENGRKVEVYIDMDGNAEIVGKYEEQ